MAALLIFLFVILYLLFFPASALDGARDGLLLWYHSVLPVLFPFMFVCGLALRLDVISRIPAPFIRFTGKIFRCSANGCFAVITGFLCGFPVGAKVTADLLEQKKITSSEAKYLFGFVNNLSPAFLVSFLAAEQMRMPALGGAFLFNILGAAALYGIAGSRMRIWRSPHPASRSLPASRPHAAVRASAQKTHTEDSVKKNVLQSRTFVTPDELFRMFDAVIDDTIRNSVRLGVCIVLFSILGSAAGLLVRSDAPAALLVRSSLEVTGGIRLLCTSGLSFPVKYIAVSMLCAFGGWSAAAQTVSIAGLDSALARSYIKSRVIITLLAGLLSVITLLWLRFAPFR